MAIENDHWLAGAPVDPLAEPPEPLPAVPGVPFGYAGASLLVAGPTGSGRSSLLEAMFYDAARAGTRCAYVSGEITEAECNARAAELAGRRGDAIDDELRAQLANLRFLDLASTIAQAHGDPEAWAIEMTRRYAIVGIDPLSSVAAALGADFERNTDYTNYYDALIKPLTDRGLVVVQADNVGHEAKSRAKGASAKLDKADVILVCTVRPGPALAIRATKVRSVRAPFSRGDGWTFGRETQRVVRDVEGREPAFRPTVLMERVSQALEAESGLSRNGVRTAVKGRAEFVDQALRLLVDEGYVQVENAGQARRHRSIKPYRVPKSIPGPDRVPDPVSGTGSTESPPYRDSGPGPWGGDAGDRVPDLAEAV